MATIIRRQQQREETSGQSVRPVAFSFDDMSRQADHYLLDVRREAARIVQQAKAEAEEILRQSEQAGRVAAEQAAQRVLDEKVGQQMATLRPALESAVAQLVDTRGAWLDHWQKAAIQLAADMAERIIRRELEHRPEITVEWIREALELASGAAEVVLELHPADVESLGNQVRQIAQAFSNLSPAHVRPNEKIARGDCVVLTKFGSIDQQVRSQLDQLINELN